VLPICFFSPQFSLSDSVVCLYKTDWLYILYEQFKLKSSQSQGNLHGDMHLLLDNDYLKLFLTVYKQMQVLTNGIEVKLQRNALSVIEAPTGNEEDDDLEFENMPWNGSDMGEFTLYNYSF